jgi:hypothetical protein
MYPIRFSRVFFVLPIPQDFLWLTSKHRTKPLATARVNAAVSRAGIGSVDWTYVCY